MANFNDPYAPLPSLADSKSLSITKKLSEKRQKLNPNLPTDDEVQAARARMMGSGTDNVDFAQASLYRTGGNLADALRGVSNKVIGTEFEDTGRQEGWSNPELADVLAGVSPQARAEAQAADQEAMQNIAEGEYWDAFKNVAGNAPRHLAEQAGVLTELAAGAATTGGVGTAIKLAQIAKKGKKAFDAAKLAKQAESKFVSGIKKGAKIQAQTSLLNADILQGIREDYKAENNGEEPSFERMMGSGLLVAATTSFQPAIIKNFWLPQPGKLQGKNIRAKFDNQMRSMAKYANEDMLKNVAKTVAKGATKVGQAAGAEGVQEYFQTWAEVLSVKMDPEEAGGMLQAAFNEIASEENRNDATYGAFVGGVVGGAARGVTAAPTAAVGVTADVAMATGKKMAQMAGKQTAKLNFGELSDQEKTDLLNDYETAEATHNKFANKMDNFQTSLKGTDSFKDVKNEEIRKDMVNAAEGADLNDPKIFKEVRNGLIRKYGGRVGVSKTKLEGHHVYKVGKKKFQRAVEQTTELVEEYVDVEAVKKKAAVVAEGAKELGEKAVEEIKNLDTSSAVGFAELSVEYSKNQTRDNWNKVATAANNMTPEAIRKTAALFPEGSTARNRLNTKADRRESIIKSSGLKKDKLVKFKDLSDVTKAVAQEGITTQDPVAVASILRDEMKGRPDDKQSIEAIQKALDAYEQTSHFKNQKKGRITPAELKSWRKRLDKRAEAYQTRGRDAVEGILTNLATQATEAAGKAVDWTKGKFTDVEVKPEGKEIYKVKASDAGTTFLKQMDALAKEIGKLDEAEQKEMLTGTIGSLTSKERVATYKDMFDTQDPVVLAEILSQAIPGITTKTLLTELTKQTKGRPEPTKTETVTETKGEPVVPSGKIVLTEDGEYVIDKDISDQEFDEVMALLDGTTICKKG